MEYIEDKYRVGNLGNYSINNTKQVSIIITAYNKADYVLEAINSAINQTYPNIEIVIINDGSTDNSASIIQETIQDKTNIKFINNEQNNGVIYARNTAIDASSGEYILPLDADDTIEPTYIEKAVKVLEENENVGIVYCKARYFGIKNEEWDLPEYNINTFLYDNCIFCSALFRKKDFIRAGKYKKNTENSWEDWDLWLSVIELGLVPYRINEILFNYRQLDENSRATLTNFDMEKARKILLQNHFNLYLNSPDFVKNCFRQNYWKKQYEISQSEIQRLLNKRKKYKKLLKILLFAIIFETIILIAFIVLRWLI